MAEHRKGYRRHQAGGGSFVSSFHILKYEDARIELVEECPCENKEQLNRKEGEVMRCAENCVNQCIAGRTLKEWYEDNKVEVIAKSKAHYETHREEIKAYKKEHAKKHSEGIKAYKKEWAEKNREELTLKRKAYYEAHKEEHSARMKAYRQRKKTEASRDVADLLLM